jgi:hypothetical protein
MENSEVLEKAKEFARENLGEVILDFKSKFVKKYSLDELGDLFLKFSQSETVKKYWEEQIKIKNQNVMTSILDMD